MKKRLGLAHLKKNFSSFVYVKLRTLPDIQDDDGTLTDSFIDKIKEMKFEKSGCSEFHSKILGERLLGSTPYFYPFIVEFALIGASVAYIMSNHIGKRFC